ncbi:MAG TPA: fibronectin type III domain-containing protein [Niastella sp.]
MKKKIIVFKNEHDLLTLIKRVVGKTKGNAAFPNPPEALDELEKVAPQLETALVKAKSRDKEWVAIKNNEKAIALALLTQLAQYILEASKGDRALILSSGFEAVEEQTGKTKPSIESLEVELGAAGEATLRAKVKKGAVAYMHQYATEAPGPNTVWHSVGHTTGNYTFTGLDSDKRYWFRVIAIGRQGQQAHSPVVSRSIQ